MKIRKTVKPIVIVIAAVMCLIALLFIIWFIMPKRQLNVAVVDKTVPAANAESETDASGYKRYYRKHMGLYWVLNQQKFVGADKTGYDYKTDYFGPQIDDSGNVLSTTQLSDMDYDADVVYLADAYGSELYGNKYSGLSEDDIGMTSLAHSNGATIIAEMEQGFKTDNESQKNELYSMCGLSYTGWVGRYIYELQDFTDVPEWAPSAYESKYGAEWQFSGPGILLVSNEGDIIVLEEKTDFESKNLLQISIADEYKTEFGGCSKLNFYNWFELVTPDSGTQTIANYEFDLNATGMEKFKEVSSSPIFSAVTRKISENGAPAYYFSGDFNDYIQEEKINCFMFADWLYKLFSFEREGDITNFYWKFYMPLVSEILNNAYKTADHSSQANANGKQTSELSRITDSSFEIYKDDKWQKFTLNAFNINADEPGKSGYTRNYTYYSSLFDELSQSGANCIKAYDLYPPEFYRALYDSNKTSGRQKIHLLQTIGLPGGKDISELLDEDGKKLVYQNIADTMTAVNGEGSVAKCGDREAGIYRHDVSNALLGFVLDLDMTKEQVKAIDASGGFEAGSLVTASTGNKTEAMGAALCDYLLSQYKQRFGYYVPVGLKGNKDLLTKAFWNDGDSSYDFGALEVDDSVKACFFTAYSLYSSDNAVINYARKLESYSDSGGVYEYGSYIQKLKNSQAGAPVLVSEFGASTNTNMFEENTSVNGLSEEEQGNEIIRMLSAIREIGFLGGVISDFNDSWSAISDEMKPYTTPLASNSLWHNVADIAQTTGVVAADAVQPQDVTLENSDTERMKKVQFYSNPEYIYITILLKKEINYDSEQLFIGFDTYQRNDGEYMFDKNFYANSLSGMEYMIKFESKNSAGLYVTPSYNRNSGRFSSKESYSADYDLVTQLTYGNFNVSNTQFYQAGTSIRVRIPWSLLNVTDPSQRLVINDVSAGNNASRINTTMTNGFMFYLFVGEKQTKDTRYIFPISKKATGYKTVAWSKWEKVEYTLRRKSSFAILLNYFSK